MKIRDNRAEARLTRLNTITTHANTNTQRSSTKLSGPADSYLLISQSRNKILERSSSCTSPQAKFELTMQSRQPVPQGTLPAAIHISAVNRKERAKLARSARKCKGKAKPMVVSKGRTKFPHERAIKSKSFDLPVVGERARIEIDTVSSA